VSAVAPGGRSVRPSPERDGWPAEPLPAWQDTLQTLHRWTQIVGKTRLALAPMQNHWWQVTLYVTARGLGTSPMPYQGRSAELEFDFIDHRLALRVDDGITRSMPLAPMTVAAFYREFQELLRSCAMDVPIWPRPVELPDATPFPSDTAHASYDAAAVEHFWRALVQADRVFKEFRGRFIGKCSPVHFWWGAFDVACTRFSGRPGPKHTGGIPNCPDWVMWEAYSHECFSAGWWPGGGGPNESAFYAYAYPEPRGLSEAPIRPAGARYDQTLREFILPYEKVRTSQRPDAVLLDFLQSTYAAAAQLGSWDRASLERREAGEATKG